MLAYKIFLDIHIYVDKNFLKDFTKIKREERNVLFQLGNALIHSFGLFTRDSNGKEYLFTLTSIKKQKLIEKVNEKNLYVIGDKLLHHEFEEAVIKYHKEYGLEQKLFLDTLSLFSDP